MIDATAPVLVEVGIHIDAPPAAVWAAMADVGRWPAWNDRIDDAELRGPFAEGSVIHWRTTGMEIDSTLVCVEEPRRIQWDGTVGGIRGLHDWELRPDGNGTAVRIAESMSGGAASEDPEAMTSQLRSMLQTWGERLKAHVEGRSGA